MFIKRLLIILSFLFLPIAQAADDANLNYVEYVELQPPFIANYGGIGPLKYLKAEVSIKVRSTNAEVAIKHHQAHIRNNLVMLFSSQTDDTIGTPAGREKLRLAAIESIRQIMVSEYGEDGFNMVDDLLFTSFVVQN